MSTHLDQSSVYELEKLLISTQIPLKQSIQPIQKPLKTPNRLKESFSVNSNPENTQRSLENTNRNLWTNSTPMLKAVKGFCPEHPDEEISYFCFNCLSNCICPECIIHGVHKNHEVMTIKKGYPIIKNKVIL